MTFFFFFFFYLEMYIFKYTLDLYQTFVNNILLLLFASSSSSFFLLLPVLLLLLLLLLLIIIIAVVVVVVSIVICGSGDVFVPRMDGLGSVPSAEDEVETVRIWLLWGGGRHDLLSTTQ